MAAPFYTDNDVPLKFTVADDVGPVNPTSATVSVFLNGVPVVTDAIATVVSDEVSFTVQDTVLTAVGTYIAAFDVILPNGDVRTHFVLFIVLLRLNDA